MLQITDITKLIEDKDLSEDLSNYLILGLSRRLGFTQKEICTNMNISHKMHSHLLTTYQQAVRKYPDQTTLNTNSDTLAEISFYIHLIEKEIGIGKSSNQIFVGFPDAEI